MTSGLYGQELGLPPYQYFSPADYKASGRNWSIVSDSAGVIYVANSSGVLRYDGLSWNRIELPRQQIAFWVEKDHKGNIFVGANGEFGMLKVNDQQQIYYQSFLEMLDERYRDFNVIWEIAPDKEGVVFRSRKYLFKYASDKLSVLEVPEGGSRFDVAFTVRDTVFLRIYDLGLARLDGTELIVMPKSEMMADIKVNGIYQFGKEEILIASRYDGMFIYSDQGIRHFRTESDEYFIENKIYDGHLLENGNYAIATMANGIVIMTPEGKEVFRFDSSNGLENNQTLFVREIEGQLWLGTKNGIFQVAYDAPFRSVKKEFGLNGQVTGIFRINDEIYVTCNDGFYQLRNQETRPVFERVNKKLLVDCVNAFQYQDQIYVSSLDGLFYFQGDSSATAGNFSPREIHESSRQGIFLTSEIYFGVYLLSLRNGKGTYKKIDGFNRRISQIVSLREDVFLLRSIDDVYYRLVLNFDSLDQDQLPQVEIREELKLPSDTYILNLNGKIRFVNRKGLHRLSGGRLENINPGITFQQPPARIVYADELAGNRCLVCYEDQMNSFYCEKYKISTEEPLNSTGEYIYTEYEPVTIFEDSVTGDTWVGGASGLKIFRSRQVTNDSSGGKTLIREMKINNDSVVYLGLDQKHFLDHRSNDIKISFLSSAPLSSGKVLYQYRLAGMQNEWSEWSAETSIRFSDLRPGDYEFQVRSNSPYTGQTVPAILNFTIKKPWYATFWAYILYVILVLLLILWLYRMRVRSLIKKQEELEGKVLETTAKLARTNAVLHEKNIALRKLDQFKSRFFANISHDLRTPIMLLSGRIDLLKSDADTFLSEKGQEYLRKLEQDSRKLVAMTDEIQELVKIEEGKLQLEYKRVNAAEFFERITGLFDSAAFSANIELTFADELDAGQQATFDPHYIERVMYNLIANALKFTKEGGSITIVVSSSEDNLVVSVKDTGIGIPAQDLAEVFNRNFQSDNGAGMNEGLGIGLNLVKEIIALHKGTISVANNPNKGAEFVVQIPLQSDLEVENFQLGNVGNFITSRDPAFRTPANPSTSMVPADISVMASGKHRLLLVEDNPSVREYMNEILQEHYEVYLSGNGVEALDILASYKIDVIVTDLMMPVMDGIEFLRGVKERYEFQDIPVLVVSARGSQEDKYQVMELGVSNILVKPFDRNEFLLQIKNLLQRRGESLTLKMITEHVGEQNASQLTKLNQLIFDHIDDFNFKIGHLAAEFHLSERSFFRMIKNITGQSPLAYVKEVKFRYAFDLLKKKKVSTLKEASLAIGMKNTSDFNKQFRKRFGVKADAILRNH